MTINEKAILKCFLESYTKHHFEVSVLLYNFITPSFQLHLEIFPYYVSNRSFVGTKIVLKRS